MLFPTKRVVEPVTGENRCPRCDGKRVIRAHSLLNAGQRASLRELQKFYEQMLWDDDGNAFMWCQLCGGSGTATDAMERLLIGTVRYDASER